MASLLHEDITTFDSGRRYALWHDRALLRFLVEQADRARCVGALHLALRPDRHLVMATFGPSGPERCSGLPTKRYDAATRAAELGADFRLIESSLAIHRTPWRGSQQFLYGRFMRQAA